MQSAITWISVLDALTSSRRFGPSCPGDICLAGYYTRSIIYVRSDIIPLSTDDQNDAREVGKQIKSFNTVMLGFSYRSHFVHNFIYLEYILIFFGQKTTKGILYGSIFRIL